MKNLNLQLSIDNNKQKTQFFIQMTNQQKIYLKIQITIRKQLTKRTYLIKIIIRKI